MADRAVAQTVYACSECSAIVVGDRDAATVMMHDPTCLYLGVIWEFLARPEGKLIIIWPTGRGIQDNDQGAYLDISIAKDQVYLEISADDTIAKISEAVRPAKTKGSGRRQTAL
jgi:hypothetical protein